MFFAKVAIDLFASFANDIDMKDLDLKQRRWLIEQLRIHGRGARTALSRHLGIRPDAITRMTNLDGAGEGREISLSELVAIAEFFKAEPPGIAAARVAAELPTRASIPVRMVPVLDSVPAGKLAAPASQLPVEDIPLLAFADLGRGDFIALTVKGTSMDRISPDGSVIIINRADKTLVSGKCYVFNYRGQVTYKRWRGGEPPYLEPYSTDPEHSPIFLRRKQDMEVIGRVKRSVLDL